jgi:hypothetical protein
MANRRFSVFVSNREDGQWWVVSPQGENGPYAAKAKAYHEAVRHALLTKADHIWVQSARGEYVQEWRREN